MTSTPGCASSHLAKVSASRDGKNVDDLVEHLIDEDGSVSAATLPGKIIHAQDARRRGGRCGMPSHQAQECIMTDRHAQQLDNRLSCSTPPSAKASSQSAFVSRMVRRA